MVIQLCNIRTLNVRREIIKSLTVKSDDFNQTTLSSVAK